MVNWLFLPQNFGQVMGTYKGFLQLCECTLGGGSIFRWWGHYNLDRGETGSEIGGGETGSETGERANVV